jgi:hypothetical protein
LPDAESVEEKPSPVEMSGDASQSSAVADAAPLTQEEKSEISEKIYLTVRNELIRRYGSDLVRETPEHWEFSIKWVPKEGGDEVTMSVSINSHGGLRLVFSKSAVRRISSPYDKIANALLVVLHEGTQLALSGGEEGTPTLQCVFYPGTKYSEKEPDSVKKMQQLVTDLIKTVLMA